MSRGTTRDLPVKLGLDGGGPGTVSQGGGAGQPQNCPDIHLGLAESPGLGKSASNLGEAPKLWAGVSSLHVHSCKSQSMERAWRLEQRRRCSGQGLKVASPPTLAPL